jgi:chromate reductase
MRQHVTTYNVGYFVGSLSSTSVNRIFSRALIRLAPEELQFTEIPIGNLPLYSPDHDMDYPPEATGCGGTSSGPMIGASIGAIGTALAQQSLRAVLSFCNARQMTSPEAYIRFSTEVFHQDGEVVDESTAAVLRDYMLEFRDHVVRVLTVLPRP